MLKPAPKGTGIIAGGAIRIILDLAGVSNVVAKILGSKSKINNVSATIKALKQLKESPAANPNRKRKRPSKKEEAKRRRKRIRKLKLKFYFLIPTL